MTINFNILAPVAPSATFSVATTGRPYPATTISASGGSGSGYSFAVTGGNLPTGLSLSGGGSLTGTTTAAGTFNFTVQATDSGSNSGSGNFGILVNPALSTVATATIQRTTGQAYSASYSASGGTAPIGYSVSSGTIAPGAVLNSSTGVLTGIAGSAATGSFVVTASDANGSTASKTVSYVISTLPTITMSTPAGNIGQVYSQTISFGGALSSASIASGSLPTGLSLTSGGTVVSGTPTASGTFTVVLSGIDTNGVVASSGFTILVNTPVVISTSTLPTGNLGVSYSANVIATGGAGPIAFTLSAGALPQGLTLSSAGTISGTPTTSGTVNFTVRADDGLSPAFFRALAIQVIAPPIVISTTTLSGGSIGSAYSDAVVATGGSGGLQFTVTTGVLPAGLILSSGGLISGIPTVVGTSNFTVSVTDAFSNSASRVFSIAVISPISITSNPNLPPTTVGASVSFAFTTTGGTPPLTWATSGGPGVGLRVSNGILSGIPTLAGVYIFTVQVTDSNGAVASLPFTQIVNPALAITNLNLGGPYSRNGAINEILMGSGGTTPYQWAIAAGALPVGVLLDAQLGRIYGNFNGTGTYPLTLRLRDAAGASVLRLYSFTVGTGPQISNRPLPQATLHAPYFGDFEVFASLPIVEWEVSSGVANLPAGLRFEAGQIVGIPTRAGTSQILISVKDQNGSAGTQLFDLIVNPALSLTEFNQTMPFAIGTQASWAPIRSGGTLPFRYVILNGNPPNGMVLNPLTGALNGNPGRAGEFSFTLEVSDANQARAYRLFTLRVGEASSLRIESLPSSFPLGQDVRFPLEIRGGTAPYTVQLTEGLWPGGITLNGLTVEGRPSAVGIFPIVLSVRDSSGLSLTRRWALTVSDGLAVQPDEVHFEVVSSAANGTPQTIKFHSAPVGTLVKVSTTAPWLKVSNSIARTPGFVDIWVEPSLLPAGESMAELVLDSGVPKRVPVWVDRIEPNASDWSVSTYPGPNGSWAAVLQGAARIPFSAALDVLGLSQFKISESRGEILAPDSFLLLLDRNPLSAVPTALREANLVVRNLISGDQQSIVLPPSNILPIEASTAYLQLIGQTGSPRSTIASLLLRSTSRMPTAFVAKVDANWLSIDNPSGRLDPARLLRVSANLSGLDSGLHSSNIDIWDATGKVALKIPVELWVDSKSPDLEISTSALQFSRSELKKTIQLRNAGKTAISFFARASASALSLKTSEGLIAPGEETTVEVSASGSSFGSWARHNLVLVFGNGAIEVVEVDFSVTTASGGCVNQAPVMTFLKPGPGFTARLGQAQEVRVALRNACGQPLTGSGLTVVIPGDSAIPLLPGSDGTWHGVWFPTFAESNLAIEAVWADPVNRQSVTRWLSGRVLPD